MSDVNFNVTYCDDIRHEITGKISLIGCYAGAFYTSELPARFAKLCVHFSLIGEPEVLIGQDIQFEVKRGGEVIATATVDKDNVKAMIDALPVVSGVKNVTMQGGVELMPFEVDSEFDLESEIRIGENVLQGRKLHVRKSPN